MHRHYAMQFQPKHLQANYTLQFQVNYTQQFQVTYTKHLQGNYTKHLQGNYTKQFQGIYTKQFQEGIYIQEGKQKVLHHHHLLLPELEHRKQLFQKKLGIE